MITTKEISIKKIDNLSSEYIDSELKKLDLNVIKWAIVEVKDTSYTVNIAVIEWFYPKFFLNLSLPQWR